MTCSVTVSVYRTVAGAVLSKYSIVTVWVPRLIPAGVLVTVAVKSNEFATPAMATPVTAGAILTLLLALTTAFNALTALTFEVLACVNVKFAPPVSWPVITPVDVPTVAVGPAIGPPVTVFAVVSVAWIVTAVVPVAI